MGKKNYLIEGISGTGKTAVAEELQRRGYHVIHGDRELAYQGDPKTGQLLDTDIHEHHIWDVKKVQSVIADHSHTMSFFCGGSRNFSSFIDLLDGVFILDVNDLGELHRRIDERVARDPTDFGGKPEEKELIARLHATKEDIPKEGIIIDSTMPLGQVADEILRKCV